MWYGICIHDEPPLLKNSLYLPNYRPLHLLLHWPLTLPISYHTTFDNQRLFRRSSFFCPPPKRSVFAKIMITCSAVLTSPLRNTPFLQCRQSIPVAGSFGYCRQQALTSFITCSAIIVCPLLNFPFSAVFCSLLSHHM